MNRIARPVASLAIMILGVTACGAPDAADPIAGSDASRTVPTEDAERAAVVDACPGHTGPGPTPAEPSSADASPATGTDPRELVGPSTAEVSEDVKPITDEAQPELPVTVRSCDGVEVEVTDVSRIVTADLFGTLGEIVFSLGLGRNVVGRDTSMGFAQAKDVPVVTPGGHDLNAEAILELDPTVVLTDASIGPPEVQQQLRDAGVPVIFFSDSRTLAAVPDQISAVAGALGVPAEGDRLVEGVTGEIADAVALAPAGVEPLRVTFLYIRGTAGVYLMAGPGSGADSLIESIGAVDVGTEIGLDQPFTPLTSEALIKAGPEVIIMMTGGLESVGGVDGLLDIPGVAQTPAGEDRRVVDVNDTDLLSFGPRSAETITALAEAVYQQ